MLADPKIHWVSLVTQRIFTVGFNKSFLKQHSSLGCHLPPSLLRSALWFRTCKCILFHSWVRSIGLCWVATIPWKSGEVIYKLSNVKFRHLHWPQDRVVLVSDYLAELSTRAWGIQPVFSFKSGLMVTTQKMTRGFHSARHYLVGGSGNSWKILAEPLKKCFKPPVSCAIYQSFLN